MIDIREIMLRLRQHNPITDDVFTTHAEKIIEFVDEAFLQDDNLLYSLVQNTKEHNLDIPVFFHQAPQSFSQWNFKKVVGYIDETYKVMRNLLFVREKTFNHVIFIELKNMIRFLTDKITSHIELNDYTTSSRISEDAFFLQSETYSYMYSFFDKLSYTAYHLNARYLHHEYIRNADVDIRFHANFFENSAFLAKDDAAREMLQTKIELIVNSTLWHYLRKIRNSVTHDFSDPTKSYNLVLELKLLYINICRVIFLLDKTLKPNDEMIDYLKALED